MLQSIRHHAQGWIAGVIVGLIILTFALFGVNSYLSEAGSVDIAVINGKPVSLGRYQVAFNNYRRQIQSVLGDQVNVSELNQDVLKKEALEQLIVAELLVQLGKDEGMRISDAQVAASIRAFDAFQRDGQFAQDLYERRTRDIGLSIDGFEAQMREDLLNEQLRLGIANSNFITPAQVALLTRIEKQTRDIGYSIISSKDFLDQVEVTDDKLEAYYKDNLDQYRTEEKVKLAYIELSLNTISDALEFTEEDLKSYYDTHQSEFTVAEQRSANHILVHVPNEASDEEQQAAREKADDLLKQAREGADFEELARTHSDDVGSKAEGGATGFFARGFMVPGFDEVVFEMQPGQISEPVRTSFGFHIIRLNEIKEGGIEPFADIKDKVEAAYKQSKAQEEFYAMAEELSNLSFENPDSLQPASDAVGLPIQTTDYFSVKGGEGIAAQDAVVKVAFGPDVKNERLNSKAIELGENQIVVIRLDDLQESRQLELTEVRSEVESSFISDTAKDMAYEKGREVLEQLKAGEQAVDVAARNDIQWTRKPDVTRQDGELSRAILRSVFKLGRPQDDKPLFGGVPMGIGDYAVVAVYKVNDPDMAEVKGKFKEDLSKEIERVSGRTEWKDFVGALREDASIDIFSERL